MTDLFQHIFLDFYGHIIAENAINNRKYPQSAAEYGQLYLHQWFKDQPPGFQTLAILILVCICFLVQYWFQDRLVTALWSRFAMQRFGAS